MKKLYALMVEKEFANSTLFKQAMGNDYKWKQSDYVYFSLNEAVRSKNWIPKEVRDKVVIHEFIDNGEVK